MMKAKWICLPPKNSFHNKHLLKVIPMAMLPNLQVLKYLMAGCNITNICIIMFTHCVRK